MRRSVVLKLLARGKVQMAHRYGRRVSDPVPPAKSRQRRVGKLGPFRRQLLMDSHQIPLALLEKLQDLLPIGFGFLWTLQLRHSAGVRAQHFAYRHSRYPQDPRNFPLPHPLRMQFENYRSLCLTQHAFPPEEVFPGCRGVVWQSARPAAAPPHAAVDPAPLPPPRSAAVVGGSRSPPPSPDHGSVRRPIPAPLSPVSAFGKTARDHLECVCGRRLCLAARRHRVGRLRAYRSDAPRKSSPCAGNLPGCAVPPAPDTSSLPAPRSSPRAPDPGSLPAEARPKPAAAPPTSHYDRNAALTLPGCSRNAAPSPPA